MLQRKYKLHICCTSFTHIMFWHLLTTKYSWCIYISVCITLPLRKRFEKDRMYNAFATFHLHRICRNFSALKTRDMHSFRQRNSLRIMITDHARVTKCFIFKNHQNFETFQPMLRVYKVLLKNCQHSAASIFILKRNIKIEIWKNTSAARWISL